MMIREILEVVRGEIPVFIDCGIESGMDVYKCLALGATAVSVGRHLMPLLKKVNYSTMTTRTRPHSTLTSAIFPGSTSLLIPS